jgi:adenine specific DNA methylase Mod
MSEQNKKLKFDKRLLEWNMNHGQLSKEELKKHLDELPDLANKVDVLRMGHDSDKQNQNSGETH